jgi:hypothetical protein
MNGPAPEKFRDPTLVDFGSVGAGRGNGPGRRLELLGGVLVDRPLAQADLPRRSLPTAWQDAGAIFHAGIAIGKFQGVMMPMTPSGSRIISTSSPARTEFSRSPVTRNASPAK